MIKRMNKELFAETGIFMISTLLIVLTLFAMVFVQLLFRSRIGEVCVMDAFAWISFYLPLSIYPITIFTTIMLTKNDFKPEKLLRMGSYKRTWIYAVTKSGIASFLLTIEIFFCAIFYGFLLSPKFSVWERRDSLCFAVGYGPFTNINYVAILLTFFFCVFLGAFATGIIPLLTYWAGNTYIAGTILSLMICIGGTGPVVDYNLRRGVFYSNINSGIDVTAQFLLPLYVIFIVTILGCLVHKKEFLAKGKI